MCNFPDCKTQPAYNFEAQTKKLYCSIHKLEGMINVRDKMCIHPNCKTQPCYNFERNSKKYIVLPIN